jgi:hypothetical protein
MTTLLAVFHHQADNVAKTILSALVCLLVEAICDYQAASHAMLCKMRDFHQAPVSSCLLVDLSNSEEV